MYKSKLQQLCQQKLWLLPKYSCLKDGPDHCPSFKASVLVNGESFDSAPACKSSKEAQNDAAMRAFVCLGSDSTAQSDVHTVEDEPVRPGLKNGVADGNSEIPHSSILDNALISIDVQCPYKLQLQTYAHRNHLSLPSYSITSIGPPHSCHFLACVTVGEQDFKSSTSSRTVKEAENAAARAALTSLSPDGFEQICPGYVKNLLQELAQKEGLSLPIYKTSRSGPLNVQLFYSAVEVGGEIFNGKVARSKKLSEINAAEVAYHSLEDRRLNRTSSSEQLSSPEVNYLVTKDHCKSRDAIQEQAVNKSCLQASDSCKINEQVMKYQLYDESIPIKNSHTNGQFIVAEATRINKADGKVQLTSQSAISPPVVQIEAIIKTQESKHSVTPLSENLSALSVADSGPWNSTACQSYLLCNRVRVYSCIPDIKFPKGITLIPIGDSKWVPASLEFPNEEGI